MSSLRFAVAAMALACTIGTVSAQNTTPETTAAPARETSANATNPPLPGANSFTEAQARDRIAAAGFNEVKELKKDDQGVWRGMARKGDSQVNVALDYRGNVVQE
jgi:putative membrane protein